MRGSRVPRPRAARRRALAALTAAVLALGAPVAAVAAPHTATPPAAPRVRPPVSVTLITGDQVRVGAPVGGHPAVTVVPADRGGRPVTFQTRYSGDDVYVLPSDVASLVPGVLDAELFDVTALVRQGYDDAHRDSLPLIVRYAPGTRSLAAPAGLRTGRALGSIDAVSASLAKSATAGFADRLARLGGRRTVSPRTAGAALGGIAKVWLDRTVRADTLDANLTRIGAPAAWDAGLDGAGVRVAVLDSGVDAGHPDLAGRVGDSASFTGSATADDDNGHGTHVASLLAGSGAAADGARRGVAYRADLVVGKVLAANGTGQLSWVIAGMQWAVAEHASVVSMSLGAPPAADDPVAAAVDELSASSDTLFVVAAGNSGPGNGSIESPGIAAAALTVGATDGNDAVPFFSSRGPTRGDHRLKPEITAPGVSITGARAGGGTGNPYTQMSGTSQATPQVAGAAALLRQEHPQWTAARVKAALSTTASPYAKGTVWDQGAGRLDLARASTTALTADVSTVDFGAVRWPHAGPVTKTVTLTNDSAAAVTVTPNATFAQRSGTAAPAGTLAVAPSTVDVPAHGSAAVTVTLDPNSGPAAEYGGTLVLATDSGDLRLPVGGYVEPERYDVSVTVTDHLGRPYAYGRADVVNADNVNGASAFNVPLDAHGHGTARVAPGWYSVQSRVETDEADGTVESVAFTGDPEVRVAGDTAVALDARDAVPLVPTSVPHVPTRVDQAQVYESRYDAGQGGYIDSILPSAGDLAQHRVLVQPTAPVTHGVYGLTTRFRLLPTGKRAPADVYDVVQQSPVVPRTGALPFGERDVRDLARLDVTYHALGAPATTDEMRADYTDLAPMAVGAYRPVALPSRRTELVTAAPGVRFQQEVRTPGAASARLYDPVTVYEPGERRAVHWFRTLAPTVVDAPRYPTNQWLVTGLGDGEHAGSWGTGSASAATLALSRDGTPVGANTWTYGYFPVAAGPATFTADSTVTVDPARLSGFASARTRWTFWSRPTNNPGYEAAPQPAVPVLDYQPALDSTGHAVPGRPTVLGLRATHVSQATLPAGTFRTVTLAYSSDAGATWHRVHLAGTAGRYAGVVPALPSGTAVSLKAAATDSAGNAIEQTVIGIWRVR